jgi:hypothetical protein
VPALQGVPLVGDPSLYCHVDPGDSTITFGQITTFAIGSPSPDASIFELDGTAQGFACTASSQCNVPSFTVPTFQNFIAGNVKDLQLCVPARVNTDCNNVGGSASPPPSERIVSAGRDFQLLVADDPTYKPGSMTAPVPWDGLFRILVNGPCHLNTGPDHNNGDVPPSPFPGQPGYSDSDQNGVGPYSEFDVSTTGKGTCTITATEDTKYITDYSDPQHPKPRSTTVSVSIQ